MLAAGIDPGLDGALAVVNEYRQLTHCWDMPTFERKHGKRTRRYIDPEKLFQMLQAFADIGVNVVTCEDMSYQQAGQMGAGKTGVGFGYLIMGMVATDPPLRREVIASSAWKASMKLTGPKSYSVRRAQEIFPTKRHWFYGPMGGMLDGRAEAALLAEYGFNRYLSRR